MYTCTKATTQHSLNLHFLVIHSKTLENVINAHSLNDKVSEHLTFFWGKSLLSKLIVQWVDSGKFHNLSDFHTDADRILRIEKLKVKKFVMIECTRWWLFTFSTVFFSVMRLTSADGWSRIAISYVKRDSNFRYSQLASERTFWYFA